MIAFATRRYIHQGNIDHRGRLRYRLAAGFTQQYRPAGNRQFCAGRFESFQTTHAPRHDQGMVGGAPEQHAVVFFPLAHRRQQFLLGMQAGLDSHIH
ncbi:hypothetical protein D9M71_782760 [compost metagenome]